MKQKKYKYITIVSMFAVSFLILFDWFTIEAVGTKESHSFLTIPSMLVSGADFLTQLGGKAVAITVVILGACLEYMCLVACALGIWGAIRSIKKKRKSKLVVMSQLVFMSIASITVIAVLLINVVSVSILGGIVSVMPTIWLIAFIVFLIISFISGSKYPSDAEIETHRRKHMVQ